MEGKESGMRSSIWPFVAKTAAVFALTVVFLDFVLADFREVKRVLENNFKTEQAKLYILSFVQNPAALYKTSEIKEKEGKLERATLEMELAIGLLEMHNADKQVINRYYARLEKLQAEVKAKTASSASRTGTDVRPAPR